MTIIITVRQRMLLIGGSGLLGVNWQYYNSVFEITPTYSTVLPKIKANWEKFTYDGSNFFELKRLIYYIKPKYIVNCAAITDVEKCEKNSALAKLINTDFPEQLAILANSLSCKFIHISTDHYNSEIKIPRKESDKVFPVNIYGFTKFEAEKKVLNECPNSLIIRVNFFGYGTKQNPSLMDKILSNLSNGQKFYGFDDVYFTPVSIKYLISVANQLITRDFSGIYNVASSDVVSKFNFAEKICEIFDYDKDLVVRGNSDALRFRTQRPKYLALDATKLTSTLNNINYSTSLLISELKSDIVRYS
jgi:dTDP-4-dehydrorhamnose reductase